MNEFELLRKYSTYLVEQPFPYKDCNFLTSIICNQDLIPAFDWYIGMIVGYSKSAIALSSKNIRDPDKAKELLSKTFFQHFPDLLAYRPLITESETPNVLAYLNAADILRNVLLEMLNQG